MLPAFNTFRRIVLIFHISTIADIHGSRPCLLNSNYFTSCSLPYLVLSFCVEASSLREQIISASRPLIISTTFGVISFHFIKDKLEHGEHIRGSLFNRHWSRRAVPEVPLSWWKFVSIFLSFPYGKLWVRPRLVELVSLELTTFWLPVKRSPNWAITPFLFLFHTLKNTHILSLRITAIHL